MLLFNKNTYNPYCMIITWITAQGGAEQDTFVDLFLFISLVTLYNKASFVNISYC